MQNSASMRVGILVLVLIAPINFGVASAQEASKSPGSPATARGMLYTSNFSSLVAGDFPPDLEFRGGSIQVDDDQSGAMLRFQGGSWFHIPLAESLPENFVIEFDYYTNESYAVLIVSAFDSAVHGSSPPSYSGYRQGPFHYFSIANTSVGVAVNSSSESLPKATAQNSAFTEGVVPVRLEVRGKQAKVFVDGKQAVMHPSATLHRTDVIEFFYASMGSPGNGFVGNVRISTL